jgi:hypothetical protein
MTNTELFYFVGKCLTLDEHQGFKKEIIQKISSDSIDWRKFVSLCSGNYILPSIYLKFKAYDLIIYLPEELAEHLSEVYQLNLSRNKLILIQLHELTILLNESGIQPVFLKGTGNLLNKLYSDPGERMIGDIDLLVPEKDYLRAAGILENDGYQSIEGFKGDPESFKHYPRLFKAGAIDVEIHRQPVSPPNSKWFSPEMIHREMRAIPGDDKCFVLSDNHNAIHNFIHSQLDHQRDAYGIISFRDLYDLYLVSKKINIALLIDQVREKRKAIAYFVFAGKAFGLPDRFYPKEAFPGKLLVLKHDLNLESPAFYRIHRTILFMAEQIFIKYIGQIVRSFYSGSVRRSLIRRISNPRWYISHLNWYRGFFIRKT